MFSRSWSGTVNNGSYRNIAHRPRVKWLIPQQRSWERNHAWFDLSGRFDRRGLGYSLLLWPALIRARRFSMTAIERTSPGSEGPVPTPGGPLSYVHWGPVIAGAVLAASIALVLHAFAAAIGLAVSSTAPTWRDASFALWFLSGLVSRARCNPELWRRCLCGRPGTFQLGGQQR